MKIANPRIAGLLVVLALLLTACPSQADVASDNIAEAAENFEIERRVVFFNGVTDTNILEIVGRCSTEADTVDRQIEVTCRTGDDEFRKHTMGLSDNVSYFVEQLDAVDVSTYNYRIRFRPETIVPDIDLDIEDSEDPGDG